MPAITHSELRPTTSNHESQTNNLLPMKKQFVVTQRYTVLHEVKKYPHKSSSMSNLLRKYKEKHFFVDTKFSQKVCL